MLFRSAALSLLLVADTSADTHFLRSLADDTNVNEAAKDHFILNPMFDDTLEVAKFIVNLNKMGFTDETRLNAGGQCDCCGCGPMDCSQARHYEERSDELEIQQLRSKCSCASSPSLGIDATIIATQF